MAKKINLDEKQAIVVVGYPKSGNTWLIRMLSDILQSPTVDIEGNDVTTSADSEKIGNNIEQSKYALIKSHFLPDGVYEKFDKKTTKVVFIYRDVRDVITSGFFYFKYKKGEEFAKVKSISQLLASPGSIMESIKARRRFNKYLNNFSKVGVSPNFVESYGIWDKHMELWQLQKDNDKNYNMTFVSYEDLLKDSYGELVRIFDEWRIEQPSEEAIREGIDKQIFKNMKKRFEELPEDSTIKRGKDYHVKFLRKGESGDWQNYFTEKNKKTVENDFNEMLRKKGYI